MTDSIKRIINAAIDGAEKEREKIIKELESDLVDVQNSDQEDKDNIVELIKQEIETIKNIELTINTEK